MSGALLIAFSEYYMFLFLLDFKCPKGKKNSKLLSLNYWMRNQKLPSLEFIIIFVFKRPLLYFRQS